MKQANKNKAGRHARTHKHTEEGKKNMYIKCIICIVIIIIIMMYWTMRGDLSQEKEVAIKKVRQTTRGKNAHQVK